MADRARLVDDIMRVASSAFGTAVGLRDEVEAQMRQRIERLVSRTDLVTRDEFEAVKVLAETALAENVALTERVEALETAAKRNAAKPASAKSSGRKTAAGKAAGTKTASKPKSTAGGARKGSAKTSKGGTS